MPTRLSPSPRQAPHVAGQLLNRFLVLCRRLAPAVEAGVGAAQVVSATSKLSTPRRVTPCKWRNASACRFARSATIASCISRAQRLVVRELVFRIRAGLRAHALRRDWAPWRRRTRGRPGAPGVRRTRRRRRGRLADGRLLRREAALSMLARIALALCRIAVGRDSAARPDRSADRRARAAARGCTSSGRRGPRADRSSRSAAAARATRRTTVRRAGVAPVFSAAARLRPDVGVARQARHARGWSGRDRSSAPAPSSRVPGLTPGPRKTSGTRSVAS